MGPAAFFVDSSDLSFPFRYGNPLSEDRWSSQDTDRKKRTEAMDLDQSGAFLLLSENPNTIQRYDDGRLVELYSGWTQPVHLVRGAGESAVAFPLWLSSQNSWFVVGWLDHSVMRAWGLS